MAPWPAGTRDLMLAVTAVVGARSPSFRAGALLPAARRARARRCATSLERMRARGRAGRVGDGRHRHGRRRSSGSCSSTAPPRQVFGWPRDAVLGQPLEMLIPERFRSAASGPCRALRRHRRDLARHGQRRRCYSGCAPTAGIPARGLDLAACRGGRQAVFTVILRDVTERVRRARALLAAQRSRACAASSTRRWTRSSPSTSSQHIVLFNDAAESVFGCPRDEALGAPLDWFMPERFRAGASRRTSRRFGEAGVASRRMGRRAHRRWAAAQRRGIPDRGLDLAGQRDGEHASTP